MKINYIVFFDGICHFCNSSVNFLMKLDQEKKLKFTSLHSEWAQAFLLKKIDKKIDFQSIIYYSDGVFYEKSDAVLQIFKDLRKWNLLISIFQLIPKRIRDSIYARVARNRYFLFGKHQTCRLLTKEEKKRFLE